jgi:hypothetical protein
MAIEVSHAGSLVAAHTRLHLKNAESLALDHYLELLLDKPGAFPGSLPLEQARQRGEFPASYDAVWSKLRARLGDKAGTKAMIEILLAHRRHPKTTMRSAIDKALALGAVSPATVEMIARQLAHGEAIQIALLEVGELARYDRPLPDTADYDLLCSCGVAS